MIKRLFLTIILSPTILLASKSDVEKGLSKFLDKYNSGSSVEEAKIYEGQMGGYATAGGLTVRNGVFNRKPLTLTTPSYSAGCSGIDLHLGSFSYISKDEMIQALKNIASSAGAYAFLLHAKAISPQAEDCMRWLQESANFINAMNINSCEIAEQAVSAVFPQKVGSQQHICKTMSSQTGYLRDIAIARQKCATGITKADNDNQGDALITSFNVAWEVIKKDPYLSSYPQHAELFMSISGTVVFNEKGEPKYYPSKMYDKDFIRSLFKKMPAQCYSCQVSGISSNKIFETKCLTVNEKAETTLPEKAFYDEVIKSLNEIQSSIAENRTLAAEHRAILNKTNLPIGRIICALTAYNRGRCPIEITHFAEHITMDVVCQYLKDIVRNIKSTSRQLRTMQMDATPIDNFLENIEEVEKLIAEYEINNKTAFDDYVKSKNFVDIIDDDLRRNIAL